MASNSPGKKKYFCLALSLKIKLRASGHSLDPVDIREFGAFTSLFDVNPSKVIAINYCHVLKLKVLFSKRWLW